MFSLLLTSLILYNSCTKELNENRIEFDGTVVDYSGLDGCGFIIELDNGDKLEPVQIADTGFVFYDGQRVRISFTLLDEMASICMVGKIVRIETIREIACIGIQDLPLDFIWDDLPDAVFDLKSAKLNGDCLELDISYSGGCEIHHFTTYLLPVFCGTPPIPPPTIVLCHEDNEDLCEAYISEKLFIDLTSLRVPDKDMVEFQLILNYNGSDYQKSFNYYY
jgi:hypothetical protein